MFSRIKEVDKILFAKHLSLMLTSGVPLSQSIGELAEESSGFLKKVLQKLNKEIKKGKTVSAALAEYQRTFGSLFINMIRIGEESGTLEESLKHLAFQLERTYDLRKKVKGAMMYPVLVLGATITIALGLAIFILPKLLGFFRSLNVKLPLVTRILLAVVANLERYWLYYLGGSVILVVFIKFLLKIPKVKLVIDRFLIEMPVFGKIIKEVNLAYFSRTLGTLLKSGVTIVEALEISADNLNNAAYRQALKEASFKMRKGENLSVFLRKMPHMVPKMITKMIEIGEKSGSLEEVLFYMADFYEKDVDDITKNLANILEPILLIGVGLIVGLVAISILMPIYQFTSSIQAR